ncbi:LysR family transcriptional regulator [Comamonas thiooxydans]|uniref:LysR family transcriptional regulator n=1 Tax=Comamonas thiooxydans TaxID=363952 RepID=UPI000B36296F|nr:LysR family transcriptional regulator [Comamonas thiooxydans]BDR09186.1 LysR family transcriptional regulator [Comamonas thiooxydans]
MDITTHIQTFVEVVRCNGFSEAARQLHVVPSVIAKRVSQLEQELQIKLFDRTTRRVTLTEAGERLHARAASVVAEFEELMHDVRRDEGKPEGHLRVMAPTTLTMEQLGGVFCCFLAAHPRITMEISLVDRSTNPAESGFDIAISGRAASYEGVVDVPLCPVNLTLCAAPAYLEQFGMPNHPRDLADHACLAFSATGLTWAFQSNRGALTIDVRPRLIADDNRTLLRAALQALGVVALPQYIAGPSLDSGALVEVLPKFPLQENWFKAYVPRRKMSVTRVRALLDYLQANWSNVGTQ